MRFTAPRMHVVKKEDKEAKARDFIREALAVPGSKGPFMLMALSEESPVARALASMAGELEQAGVSVRAVFAEASANSAMTSEAALGLERIAIVRRASDARLLDAHEQLILSATTVWTGDCMRRNPSTRDAYETFALDHADMVVWGLRAFNQFWSKAKPLRLGKPAPAQGASEVVPGEGALAAATGGDFTPAVGATRH
jgi:hypothetical protein